MNPEARVGKAINFTCPTCGAKPGDYCVRAYGAGKGTVNAKTHRARWIASGEVAK